MRQLNANIPEIFKAIRGFPAYRISNTGRVQSSFRGSWRDLKSAKGKRYLGIVLCCSGKHFTRRIHNLVALAFLTPKPKGKVCLRHLDGNSLNNCADNLAWGTYSQNEQDKRKHGTYYARCSGKLSVNQVKSIRAAVEAGSLHAPLALQFGISRPTVTRIANRVIWRHI